MLSVDVREESVDVELTGNANAMSTKGMQLGYVTGVILRDRMNAFERMLWRVCRGNVFLKSAEIPETIQDPATVGLFISSTQKIENPFLPLGRSRRQGRLRRFLPRRTTEDTCPKDLRRVRGGRGRWSYLIE